MTTIFLTPLHNVQMPILYFHSQLQSLRSVVTDQGTMFITPDGQTIGPVEAMQPADDQAVVTESEQEMAG